MTKLSYLHALKTQLKGLDYDDISSILFEIDQHFSERLSKGKTEEQIIDILGTPKAIAFTYKTQYTPHPDYLHFFSALRAIGNFIAIGFSNPLLLPLFLGLSLPMTLLVVCLHGLYLISGLFVLSPLVAAIWPRFIILPFSGVIMASMGLVLFVGTKKLHQPMATAVNLLTVYGLKFTQSNLFMMNVLLKDKVTG